jgi:hypothetical protein
MGRDTDKSRTTDPLHTGFLHGARARLPHQCIGIVRVLAHHPGAAPGGGAEEGLEGRPSQLRVGQRGGDKIRHGGQLSETQVVQNRHPILRLEGAASAPAVMPPHPRHPQRHSRCSLSTRVKRGGWTPEPPTTGKSPPPLRLQGGTGSIRQSAEYSIPTLFFLGA